MNEYDFQAAIDGAIHTNFHGADLAIAGVKHPTPHFRFLTGDINFTIHGGKWVSRRFDNTEFNYWLVIELRNNHEDTGDAKLPTYYVSVSAVSPEQASAHLDAALESMGLDGDEFAELREKPLFQVEALNEYGINATLWHAEGNNWRELMKAAHRQALFINAFFGFYMDAPENRIGNTGWDFISGDIGFK